MSRMIRLGVAIAVVVLVTAHPSAGSEDRLAEARRLYNQDLYELAIKAADVAKSDQAVADEASLIIGRSQLERYRQTHDAANLTAAQEHLRALDASKLSARGQAEFAVGLGEWLFLDDRYGAAAELFDGALGHADDLGPTGRERVLDWWATAMDRYAQVTPQHRTELYERIVERMEDELRDRPSSIAASYWIPAAARSMGDLDRAWYAAIAGWLRARLNADRGAALRPDLDRLVETAIIPERARELAGPGRDPKDATDAMFADWQHLKAGWD
jgi:hypothetical protein